MNAGGHLCVPHLLGAARGGGSAVVWVSPPRVLVWSQRSQRSQTAARGADLFIARPFSTNHHRPSTSIGRMITYPRRLLTYPSSPQTDVMHQSVYELVHTEDQQELRRNLHWALNPPAAASTSSQDSPQGDSSLACH